VQIYWLEKAKQDLDNLIDYILTQGGTIDMAIIVGDAIENHVSRLIDHPKLGKPGRKDGTRELVHPKYGYLIQYTLHQNRIVILNIFRGQQVMEPPL